MEFKAEGFKTLPEALEWAKGNSFDVLLSDYYVSDDVHAQDVLKAIVEIKGKTFKSVVLTNYLDPTKMEALRAAGFDGLIEKPLSLEKFKIILGV